MQDSTTELIGAKEELWIETASGRRFYFNKPEFHIDDIADASSRICRFTGHCRMFYSLAEHAVLVADLMYRLKLGDPLEGLLHDAHEAYIGDVSSPLKALLPDYRKLEQSIEAALRRDYGLPAIKTDGCKQADWLALFIEAENLLPSHGAGWIAPPGIAEQAAKLRYRFPVYAMSCFSAERKFKQRFVQYSMDSYRVKP